MKGRHQHNQKPNAFGEEQARNYDRNNFHLVPIQANLHYLIEILLTDLNPDARILCVGAGTGTEIISLATAFPNFRFVAADPSKAMLDVCLERIQRLGLADRCQMVAGSIDNVPEGEDFDAALCLLVLHHTTEDERLRIVKGIARRLKPHGVFISSELSFDFAAEAAGSVMENWKSLIRRAGLSEEKIQNLPAMMKQHLCMLPPSAYETLLTENGFRLPVQFFQSFLIRAWYARRLSN